MRRAMENVGNRDENVLIISRSGSGIRPVKSWNAPDPSCWRVHHHEEDLVGSFSSAEEFANVELSVDGGDFELVRSELFVNEAAVESPPPHFTVSPPNSIESDAD